MQGADTRERQPTTFSLWSKSGPETSTEIELAGKHAMRGTPRSTSYPLFTKNCISWRPNRNQAFLRRPDGRLAVRDCSSSCQNWSWGIPRPCWICSWAS